MLGSNRVARLRSRKKEAATVASQSATVAAIYLRVSTEEQAERGHGLAAQGKACIAFAESQGYEVAGVFEDPGISGATKPADRPGFGQIIEVAQNGKLAVLLVYKFDRLARSIAYAVEAVHLLEGLGVVLRSVTEPIDTGSPMGRTIFAIFAGMAEQERHTITERTHGGRREKASKGGLACGYAPLGYASDGHGGLSIVQSEAETVRRIFALRAEGLWLKTIAERLNAEGLRGRRGGVWRAGQVAYVLDNPKYRGAVEYLFRWQGAEQHVVRRGKHKAIIDGRV